MTLFMPSDWLLDPQQCHMGGGHMIVHVWKHWVLLVYVEEEGGSAGEVLDGQLDLFALNGKGDIVSLKHLGTAL